MHDLNAWSYTIAQKFARTLTDQMTRNTTMLEMC